jgi:ABC-type glycerol-3-phosphate transport system substrate-binding protein
MKRALGILLSLVMALSAVACSNKESAATPAPAAQTAAPAAASADAPAAPAAPATTGEHRVINVGQWWDWYYDSSHDDIFDDEGVSDTVLAQLKLDAIRMVEEKYDVEVYFHNLTWDGTIESINTSIMAGTPDMDVYYTDLQFGIPAVLNGYAQPISSFAADGSDIYGDQVVMKYLNIMSQDESYLFANNQADLNQTYFLGFNLDMIEEAGLENPQDLFDAGQWTWDKWREQLIALTKDTDGDGSTDVYGWSGYWTNLLPLLLFSNNAGIANSPTQGIDSPNTIETLDFISSIYNIDKTARPWIADDWESNNKMYAEGKSAFWIGAPWIFQNQGGPTSDPPLSFNFGVVPVPVGPHGSVTDYPMINAGGNWCIIPNGVKDPERVYNVLFDLFNWHGGDLALRDNSDWIADLVTPPSGDERNFNYLSEIFSRPGFEIFDKIGASYTPPFTDILDGVATPAQFAEQNKQIVQDALSAYFGS